MLFDEWRKLPKRLFPRTKQPPQRRASVRPCVESLETRWLPAISAVGQAATFVEGNASSAQLATFTDITAHNANQYSAVINWGDASANSTVTPTLASGVFTVTGSHTYAEETPAATPNTFTVVITDTADSDTATVTNTAAVSDAPLTPTPVTFTTTEFVSSTGVVANFTDTDPIAPSGQDSYTATIDWGDGTTDTGTVSGSAGHPNYSVSGTHTYFEDGPYSVKVTVQDSGSAIVTVTSTANVMEDDLFAFSVAPITTTEGTALTNVSVATFFDGGDPGETYSATIDWGDGTVTSGTFLGSGFDGTITGSHTYGDEGTFAPVVTITETHDTLNVGSVAVTDTVVVSEADVLVPATGQPTIVLTEGRSASTAVAFFSNTSFPGNVATDFSATINWGDTTSSAGTVSGGSGTFTVSGSHAYGEENTYTVTTTIADDSHGTAGATATNTATVTDAPLTNVAGVAVTGTEFTSTGTVSVATFTDPAGAEPGALGSHYSATIDWGDGTGTTTGTIVNTAGNNFSILGSHTYTEDGNYTVTTTILHEALPAVAATSTVAIAELPVVVSGVPVSAGQEFIPLNNVPLATFTHGNSGEAVANFSATIDWGDFTTSTGNITLQAGVYTVTGSHLYSEEKFANPAFANERYTISVHVTDGPATAIATTTVQMLDLPPGVEATATPIEKFVAEAYNDLFHRAPDLLPGLAGLNTWVNQYNLLINLGFPPLQAQQQVFYQMELDVRQEYFTNLVASFYQTYLKRAESSSDAASAQGMVNYLSQSAALSPQTLAVAERVIRDVFVLSTEYSTLHNSATDNTAWVTALYQDALHRSITGDIGAMNFINGLNANTISRPAVAYAVFSSGEFATDEVALDYLAFLTRPPNTASDLANVRALAFQILQGAPEEAIIAELAGSTEYNNKP